MHIYSSLVLLLFLPSCGQSKQNKKEISTPSKLNGFEMVSVKGGTFLMGGLDHANDSGPIEPDPEHGDECPHPVTVKDF